MSYGTTEDGTEIFFKDWDPRDAQPIAVFDDRLAFVQA